MIISKKNKKPDNQDNPLQNATPDSLIEKNETVSKEKSSRLRFSGKLSDTKCTDASSGQKPGKLRFSHKFSGKKPGISATSVASPSPLLAEDSKDFSFVQYSAFKKRKLELAKILNDASSVMSTIKMEKFTKKLQAMKARLLSDSFKIQIVGTFKNGKSTFINSFLGEEVLPAYALPCTAVINEVKYGDEKKAIIHFKNPVPETLPSELSPNALKHIRKHNFKNVPPMEIPYDKIEDYVVIPMGKDPKDMLLETPYEKVELFWPLEILKNGIEIIDSPGLNEHSTRTKVTMEFLNKADAIIFVLNATALCTKEEMTFIEHNLYNHEFHDLFFAVNRFDMIPQKEKARIVKFAETKLSHLTSFGKKGIFFISARDALDARISSDSEKLKSSSLPALENDLSRFLTKHRGTVKLLAPAEELKRFLREEMLKKFIPRQKSILESSAKDFKEKYNKIGPELNDLERRQNLLSERIRRNIENNKQNFEQLAKDNIDTIIASTPEWINEVKPTTKLGMFSGKKQIQEASTEIINAFSAKLEKHNDSWNKNVLQPAINESSEKIFESSKADMQILMKEISHTGDLVAGGKTQKSSNSPNDHDVNFKALLSYDETSKSAIDSVSLQIAGRTLLVMLSMASTLLLAGVLTAFFLDSGNSTDSSVMKKLKKSLSDEITATLKKSSSDFTESLSESISKHFSDLSDKIISPVNEEIDTVRNQLDNAVAEMEQDESAKRRKKEILNKIRNEITRLYENLDSFISTVKSI